MGYAPFVPHPVRRRCWRFTPTKEDPCFAFLIDLVRSYEYDCQVAVRACQVAVWSCQVVVSSCQVLHGCSRCRCTSRRTRFGTKRCTLQRKPRQAAWFRGKHQEPPKGTLRRPNPRLCQVVYMLNTICYRYSPISCWGPVGASQWRTGSSRYRPDTLRRNSEPSTTILEVQAVTRCSTKYSGAWGHRKPSNSPCYL